MVLKAILITDNVTVDEYFFSFILSKMKFEKIVVVCIGNDFLVSTESGRRFYLGIPLPNRVAKIDQLNMQQQLDYARSIVDLIKMSVCGLEEDYCCFFQNFTHAFLFNQIKEETKFKLFSFFNEDILSINDYKLDRYLFKSLKSPAFHSIIYTSSEVAIFLNKKFEISKKKLHKWYYRNNSLGSMQKKTNIDGKYYLKGPEFDKYIVFYGRTLSTNNLTHLVETILALKKKDSQVKIYLIGHFDYDFILKNINIEAKVALIFMGEMGIIEMRSIFLNAYCVIYLGDKRITDNSFLTILENEKPFITFRHNLPLEIRSDKYFYPIITKSTSSLVVAKTIVRIFLSISHLDLPQIELKQGNLYKEDFRINRLEQIILSDAKLSEITI